MKEAAAATPAVSDDDFFDDDVEFEDELLVLAVLPHAAATKPRLATTNPIRMTGCFNASPFYFP